MMHVNMQALPNRMELREYHREPSEATAYFITYYLYQPVPYSYAYPLRLKFLLKLTRALTLPTATPALSS